MNLQKARLILSIGSLSLVGICLRLWTDGNYSHFASGFLLGLALVFLIAGVAKSRRTAE